RNVPDAKTNGPYKAFLRENTPQQATLTKASFEPPKVTRESMTETRDLVAQLGIGDEEDGRPSPKKTPDNSGSSPRTLVVEDERIVALDLATTLNNLGYTIAASVSSGEAAIENAV